MIGETDESIPPHERQIVILCVLGVREERSGKGGAVVDRQPLEQRSEREADEAGLIFVGHARKFREEVRGWLRLRSRGTMTEAGVERPIVQPEKTDGPGANVLIFVVQERAQFGVVDATDGTQRP